MVYGWFLAVYGGRRVVYGWYTGGIRMVYGWYTDGIRMVYDWYTAGIRLVYDGIWSAALVKEADLKLMPPNPHKFDEPKAL